MHVACWKLARFHPQTAGGVAVSLEPTRDEAVEILRARGFIAKPRDWAWGESIFVTHPDQEASTGVPEVIAYNRIAYLKPVKGHWVALLKMEQEELDFDTFEEAVEATENHLKGKR